VRADFDLHPGEPPAVMKEPPADTTVAVRTADQPLVRPRDAATLVLYRKDGRRIDVLMGERHAKHRFMPNRYVFPGGRVDRTDARVRAASELASPVRAKLEQAAVPSRARALALAAIRETFEETGLLLGAPDPKPGAAVPAAWQEFFAHGVAPALDRLDYVARAVTPPYRPVRFNARFFVADASHADGTIQGSGELLDLRWFPIADALELPLPRITGVMLGHVEALLSGDQDAGKPRTIPLYHYVHGKHRNDRE